MNAPQTEPAGFLQILKAFQLCRVDYVLIGMGAGWLHGSPHRTEDLDFLIRGDLDNRYRCSLALTELGAKTPLGHPPDEEDLRVGSSQWSTRFGPVDILLDATGPNDTRVTWSDLQVRAIEVTGLPGVNIVPIASLSDLIAMKRAAGRPKDFEALPELEAMLAESIAPQSDQSLPSPRQWPEGTSSNPPGPTR